MHDWESHGQSNEMHLPHIWHVCCSACEKELQCEFRVNSFREKWLWLHFSISIFIPIKVSLMKPPSVPMIVVICCGCCFLQSTIAFVILLPNIYIRRCYISINFAIMQFCLSITAMMAFIILGLLKFLPQVSAIEMRLHELHWNFN